MNEYLKAIESRLTDDAKDMLKRIYAPQVVAVPLTDARNDVCILPDGEIRSYGYLDGREEGDVFGYISSVDGGCSWTKHYAKGVMNSCTYIPEKGIYIKCYGTDNGTFIRISDIGPDDAKPTEIKISDYKYYCEFLPQKSEFTDRIWLTAERRATATYDTDDYTVPAFIYSDDFGKSWNITEIEKCDMHEIVYPHKSPRWRFGSGVEPHVAELSKDKMMMMIRTSTDYFYQCFSYDGGDTWTKPEPSVFHGTNTTPYLLKLSNGKTIAFWNNTQPLAEPRHEKHNPPVADTICEGIWANVFTNRDAAHAAITDDAGETWKGFREVLLNEIRDRSDFRYYGTQIPTGDKSVHQFQAFELPYNKVLLCAGQNSASRRLLIFDINWLYDTDRNEDFMTGLGNISSQVYLKSIQGPTRSYGNGHCAMNRTNGAMLKADPDGGYMELAHISKVHDDRRVNDITGIVWNFPASKQGTVTAKLRLMEKSVRISLADHWFNACDPNTNTLAQFSFEIDTDDVEERLTELKIEYDTESGMATVSDETRTFFKVRMMHPTSVGISYLIIQCAPEGDSKGVYIKELNKTSN